MKEETIYIFNPEHDLCLANGDPNFVPPASALSFGRDCAELTRLIENRDEQNIVIPWGWNRVLRKRLIHESVRDNLLPSDKELDDIRNLSHRRVAAQALRAVIDDNSGSIVFPLELDDLKEIENACAKSDAVLKSPWSGSGKGIRWAHDRLSESDKGWCRNTIERQGSVIVEKRYNVVQEFAMLFHCNKEKIAFEGYSLFYTKNGMYQGNLLASDTEIIRRLSEFTTQSAIENIKSRLKIFLESHFIGKYHGYLGVDMFIFSDKERYFIHPCVEINVRMTMGLLARRIFDLHFTELTGKERATADAKYKIMIHYSPKPGLQVDRNTISLCPITPKTQYAVCIECL